MRYRYPNEPEGEFDPEGGLFLPEREHTGASPGGGLEEASPSGTTGRVLPPGAKPPLDDKELPRSGG